MARLPRIAFIQQAAPGDVSFGLATSIVPVALWDRAGANRIRIPGTLTLGGKPVAGAALVANAYTLPTPTDDAGKFTLSQDQTQPDRTVLRIKVLSGATVGGQKPSDADRAALQAAQAAVDVAFVISLSGSPTLKTVQAGQLLTGHLTFADKKTPVPVVQQSSYHLTGTVTDPQGKPLSGIYVSISDDEGETWSVSDATGDDGVYTLRFFPDGRTQYFIRAAVGANLYQSDQALAFGANSSARVDVVVDTKKAQLRGTNADGSFKTTSEPGAEWIGYLAGLAQGDVPVPATVTWPDEHGAFTISGAKPSTSAPVTFFQLRLRFFTAASVKPGGMVAAGIIPDKLDARTPMDLPPTLT